MTPSNTVPRESRFRVLASCLARTSLDAESFHLVSKRAFRDTEDFRLRENIQCGAGLDT